MHAFRRTYFGYREDRDPKSMRPLLPNVHLHTALRFAIGAGFRYVLRFNNFGFSTVNNHDYSESYCDV